MRSPGSAIDLQHHAKTRLAAHHPVIGRLRFLQREYLVHLGNLVHQAEGERIFGIGGCSRVPAMKRSSRASSPSLSPAWLVFSENRAQGSVTLIQIVLVWRYWPSASARSSRAASR